MSHPISNAEHERLTQELQAARSENEALRSQLQEALKWIENAPEKTWGIGSSGGGTTHWYIRDEVAANIRKLLEASR